MAFCPSQASRRRRASKSIRVQPACHDQMVHSDKGAGQCHPLHFFSFSSLSDNTAAPHLQMREWHFSHVSGLLHLP